MSKFHVTYDIVTPESAEHGDTAENGFVHANGGQDPVDAVDNADDYAMDLRAALRLCWPCEDCGSWFSELDGNVNFRTGAVETRALHPPRNITPSSYRRLKRLLGARW